jgi:tetratricopeptide (TPR) repeat protein
MNLPLKVFIIYAREDEAFKNNLVNAFIPLRRTGKIEIFHDGLIRPGERWEDVILDHLHKAQIILPLVSTDFFASDFIHEVEFKNALNRYFKNETMILPIVLKPCGWKFDPVIKTLQVLPKDGKPVVHWNYQEEAWEQVLEAVHEITEGAENKGKIKEAQRFYELARTATDPAEKIRLFSEAIRLHPRYTDAYNYRGNVKLDLLNDPEGAIKDYDQALALDSNYFKAHHNRGLALHRMKRYPEAILCFEEAIRLDPRPALSYAGRGDANFNQKRYAEAIEDYNIAIQIAPETDYIVYTHRNKGYALYYLERYAEALREFDRAIALKNDYAEAWYGRGDANGALNNFQAAIQDFNRAIAIIPDYADAYHARGAAWHFLNQPDQARRDYLKALEIDPHHEQARKNLNELS